VTFPPNLAADECVLKPRKPVRISGALCGIVISVDNGDRLEGADVTLRDASGGVLVASVNADATGGFRFPTLPKGKYQIEVSGFSFYMKDIELTGSDATMCKQPIVVYPGLTNCSVPTGRRHPTTNEPVANQIT
jgi:hypothetical protein